MTNIINTTTIGINEKLIQFQEGSRRSYYTGNYLDLIKMTLDKFNTPEFKIYGEGEGADVHVDPAGFMTNIVDLSTCSREHIEVRRALYFIDGKPVTRFEQVPDKSVKPLPAMVALLHMYSHQALVDSLEYYPSTDCDWEIVSIYTRSTTKKIQNPVLMAQRILEGKDHSALELAEAVAYWAKYARK